MIRNYFITAWRALNRHRNYSLINIVGLSLGLAAGAFSLLYLLEETSFDTFHSKGDRIYRVLTKFKGTNDPDFKFSSNNANGWPVGYALADNFPEVEKSLYLRSTPGYSINYKDGHVDEKIRMASQDFLEVFDFPLIAGDSRSALKNPNSIILTEKMAKKYFPQEDALGKIITANDSVQFTVTGIAQDLPRNSHIQFDMLMSFATYESGKGNRLREEGWFNINMLNYILIKEGTDMKAFEEKAKTLYMDKAGEEFSKFGYVAELAFEPLSDVYLRSEVYNALGPKGRFNDLIILSGITILIIVLASINFINLTTARSVDRAREVGLRKVSGSTRSRLVGQFLSESLLTAFVALLLAFAILGIFLPALNLYTNKTFTLSDWLEWRALTSILALWIVVGLSAGFYPSLVLSRFAPLQVLRGQFKNSTRGIALRRTLVMVQFFISVILIAGVFIISKQVTFMNQQSLGFSKEQVLVVRVGKSAYSTGEKNYPIFKNKLSQHSFVKGVSASNGIPGESGWRGQVAFAEGKSPEESVATEYLAVDYNYPSLLNLQIVAGRDFRNDVTDREDGLLINESTALAMGWGSAENAVGKRILSPSNSPAGIVIGVFKDFHQHGLQERIQPVVMDVESNHLINYLVRFQPGTTQEVVEKAEVVWKELFPGYEFKYTFLDDAFAQQYSGVERLNTMFIGFSVVALIIASIGLFGLSAFIVVNRIKEIGVRKILGAPDFTILSMLSKDFIAWVVVANAMAWPVLYWLGQDWLEGFAYRTSLGIEIFIATLFISLTVTLLAISFQTLQAVRMNPTQALRSE